MTTDNTHLYEKIEASAAVATQPSKPKTNQRKKQDSAMNPVARSKEPVQKKTVQTRPTQTKAQTTGNSYLRIIPLGGIDEIGKNITVYETPEDIIIVDCGSMFPDDELLGVDIVIPDFSYLVANKDKIRAVIVTHAHEDHIGGIPYLLKEISAPVFGTKLTIGLIREKLREHMNPDLASLNVIIPGNTFKLGGFTVEAINVNHSIPGAVAFAITCSEGTVIQTGDFKIDYTPISDKPINLARFAELGSKGVLALLADSTNAERMGYTPTELTVVDSFERLFAHAANKRILIASFASNIQRIQKICDLAKSMNRKIALSGRSMINYTSIAAELGYLKIDKDTLIDITEASRYADNQLIILTTGSQGEPMSALSRMASATHKQVSITPNDLIIISATPIPGNERAVNRIVNALLKWGSEVIYESMYDVHVSGHACREELKIIMKLTAPQYFIPVHGEYKHLIKNAKIAEDVGVSAKNISIPEIGNVIEFRNGTLNRADSVPSGRVLVDGSGIGDVGSVVLRDRKHLAQDGVIVAVAAFDSASGTLVGKPDIVSRGFVYVKDSEELINGAMKEFEKLLLETTANSHKDYATLKTKIRDTLSSYLYQRTKRSPMILPIITEV